MLVITPVTVTVLFASNATPKEWCAAIGATRNINQTTASAATARAWGRNVAGAWIPLRGIGFLLELRADHEFLRQVGRVVDDRRHDQPGAAILGKREAVEELLDDGALAIGYAVRTQVTGSQAGRHHFERATRGGAAAAEDTAILRLPKPSRRRLSLQRRRRGWRRSSKLQAAGLAAGVGLDAERSVVLPLDPQAAGLPNQPGRAECLAQLATRAVGVEIPGLGDLASGRVERRARRIALRRRDHPPSPVLGDDRHPLASEIQVGAGPRVTAATRTRTATLLRQRCRRGNREGCHNHHRGPRCWPTHRLPLRSRYIAATNSSPVQSLCPP